MKAVSDLATHTTHSVPNIYSITIKQREGARHIIFNGSNKKAHHWPSNSRPWVEHHHSTGTNTNITRRLFITSSSISPKKEETMLSYCSLARRHVVRSFRCSNVVDINPIGNSNSVVDNRIVNTGRTNVGRQFGNSSWRGMPVKLIDVSLKSVWFCCLI